MLDRLLCNQRAAARVQASHCLLQKHIAAQLQTPYLQPSLLVEAREGGVKRFQQRSPAWTNL